MRLLERVFTAIGIAADFRRLTRAGVCLLAGTLTLSAAAGAQATCGTAKTPPCVSVGSVIPIPYDISMNQIYKILFYKGNVLALDAGDDALYQLTPGATSWNRISGTPLNAEFLGAGFNASSMALDAVGNLYITDAFPPGDAPSALFWRFPYDPVANTWHLSVTAGAWGGNIIDPNTGTAIVGETSQGSADVQFENSPAMDGSGTLYFAATQNQIFSVPVDNQGNADKTTVTATSILDATEGGAVHMAVDGAGNIYFVEGHALTNAQRATGIWFIPAGTVGITGSAGSAEAKLERVDINQAQSTSPVVYAGVTLDAAGNLYMSSETNANYDETFSGVWEIPNVCGAPPTAANLNTCMDDNDIGLLAPIPGNQPVTVDSRGYLWLTPYQTYSPSGEATQGNVYAMAVFAPGVINLNYGLGASPAQAGEPTGKAGAAGVAGSAALLYVAFNGTFTPTSFQFSSASGTAPEFGLTQTNPLINTSNATPTLPCNNTTSTTNGAFPTYSSTNSCWLWVTIDPTVPGPVSGELTIFGTESTTTNGVTTTSPYNVSVYVNGTGLGAGVSMLNSPQLNTLASGLSNPAQVASDPRGDTWVADPGNKQVLYFPAGSTGTTQGTPIGSGLSDPTGVAVDATGDIYIADWNASKKLGTVYEIPWVPSTTTAGGALGAQTTLSTAAMGLGDNLNLAVDFSGDVFVADPQNARVVKIPTPAEASLIPNPHLAGDISAAATVTVGSGFTAPSAVAVDSAGDVFIADGTNLWEVAAFPSSLLTEITSSLPAPATGLTVDASGSVIAALTDEGLYRIPYIVTGGVGGLSVNSASLIDTSVNVPGSSAGTPPLSSYNVYSTNIVNPTSVALDQQGNIYVTDIDPTAGPNLYELSVKGFVDYGVGLDPNVADEQDLDLFNIGNEPLNLTGTPAFSGPDASLYSLTAPSAGTECDTTGATAVGVGSSCSLGPTIEPTSLAFVPTLYTGDSLTVPTNASNIGGGGETTATLQAASVNGLENTTTTVNVNLTSNTYPGMGSVTVNIAPNPATSGTFVYSYPDVPTGTVVLTLSCSSPGCTQPSIVETGTAALPSGSTSQNTSVTFNNLPSLDGGTYNVTAEYEGYIPNLMAKSSGATSFTINTATPVITLSEPAGVSPNATNGAYYLLSGSPNPITASVTSTVGSPTGTVTLLNGGVTVGTATYTSNQDWTFSTGGLAVGAYNLIASYSGDQNFSAISTSTAVAFQVIPESVLLTASPASVTTKGGTPVASTITIQSLVGFSAPAGANILCEFTQANTAPYYAECTFSNPQPAICAPSATNNTCAPASTVLTFNSNIPVNIPPGTTVAHSVKPLGPALALAGLFGLGLFGLALRRRAIFNRYLVNLVCLALFFAGTLIGIASCTNSGYTHTPPAPSFTTPSGTYNVTIQVTNTTTGVVESLPFTLGVTVQ
jgi:Bacterial Ig-like domain (group 3)